MKYIYYSLYQFYTRILKVQKHYPPVVNIAGVLALLQAMFMFLFIDIVIIKYTQNKAIPNYDALVPSNKMYTNQKGAFSDARLFLFSISFFWGGIYQVGIKGIEQFQSFRM